jgi:hypothetical protein
MTHAVFLASLVMLAGVLYALHALVYLAPYKWWIVHQYGTTIAGFLAVFFLNLVGLAYWLSVLLPLRHTGRKLTHVDHQLPTTDAIFDDWADPEEPRP